MKISTRGRYALRVMIDLAEHRNGNYIPLKDIAERQNISQKYLEGIMLEVAKAGLIDGKHGKGGGYRLNCEPDECTVLKILQITEGDLAPISCLESGASCDMADDCRTLPLWTNFYKLVCDYFGGITLADLMNSSDDYNYII